MRGLDTIKKGHQKLYTLLYRHKDCKVEDLLPQIDQLCVKQEVGRPTRSMQLALRDADNNLVALHCSYFKVWFPTTGEHAVEFHTNVNTSHGFNSQSKPGQKAYSDNRTAKAKLKLSAISAILDKVTDGKLEPEDVKAELAKTEKPFVPAEIVIPEGLKAFESVAEVKEFLIQTENIEFPQE